MQIALVILGDIRTALEPLMIRTILNATGNTGPNIQWWEQHSVRHKPLLGQMALHPNRSTPFVLLQTDAHQMCIDRVSCSG